MHGTYKRDSQLENRKMGQKVIDDYNSLVGRIKRLEEKLEAAKDERAVFHGLFPELKPREEEEIKVGGTDNDETLPSL